MSGLHSCSGRQKSRCGRPPSRLLGVKIQKTAFWGKQKRKAVTVMWLLIFCNKTIFLHKYIGNFLNKNEAVNRNIHIEKKDKRYKVKKWWKGVVLSYGCGLFLCVCLSVGLLTLLVDKEIQGRKKTFPIKQVQEEKITGKR